MCCEGASVVGLGIGEDGECGEVVGGTSGETVGVGSTLGGSSVSGEDEGLKNGE